MGGMEQCDCSRGEFNANLMLVFVPPQGPCFPAVVNIEIALKHGPCATSIVGIQTKTDM